MTEQLSLLAWRPSRDGSYLAETLQGRGWVLARDLVPLTGLTDRQLRAEAEVSGGEIITGNKGYCLLSEVSTEDAAHSARRLISQGKKMIRRGITQMNRMHALAAGGVK
jgi:hypothetical protein